MPSKDIASLGSSQKMAELRLLEKIPGTMCDGAGGIKGDIFVEIIVFFIREKTDQRRRGSSMHFGGRGSRI